VWKGATTLPLGTADRVHQLGDFAPLVATAAGADRLIDAASHVVAFLYNAAGVPIAAGALYRPSASCSRR
jgi:hypothetical protein